MCKSNRKRKEKFSLNQNVVKKESEEYCSNRREYSIRVISIK